MMKTAIRIVAGIARTAKKQTVCFLIGMIMTALFPVCSILLIKNLVNQAMILTQSEQPCIQFLFWVGLLFAAEILMQITRYSNSYWEQRLKILRALIPGISFITWETPLRNLCWHISVWVIGNRMSCDLALSEPQTNGHDGKAL